MNRRLLLLGLALPFAAAAVVVALVAAGLTSEAILYAFPAAVLVGLPIAARGAIPVWPRSWPGRGQAIQLSLLAGWLYLCVAALAAGGCFAGVSAVEEHREAAEVARYRAEFDRLVDAGATKDAVRAWAEGNGLTFAAPAAEPVHTPVRLPPGEPLKGYSMAWRRGFLGGQRIGVTYYFRDDRTLARYELTAWRPSL
jgi:hypothetical protein